MGLKARIVKKRMLLYYFLAIVLPCLVLGALAFRGIVNDQAIREKETRQLLAQTGDNIISAADSLISAAESGFLSLHMNDTCPPGKNPFFTDSIMHKFCNDHPVIECIYFVRGTGEVQLLCHDLLYYPDGSVDRNRLTIQPGTGNQFQQGWQYEFREKDPEKALNYYKGRLKDVKDGRSRAFLYLTLARLYKKLGQNGESLNTFRRIETTYGRYSLSAGYPLGAAALTESARICLQNSDTLNAAETIWKLLDNSINHSWELEATHFRQLRQTVEELYQITSLCKDSIALQKVNDARLHMEELDVLAQKTRRQLLIRDRAATVFGEQGASSPAAKSEYRIYTTLERKAAFLSVFPENETGSWIMLFDLDEFVQRLTGEIIPANGNPPDFDWQIIKDGREVLDASNTGQYSDIRATLVLPAYLPSWSLELFREPGTMLSSFLSASHGIFIWIFLLIVVVLSLGLIFTLQIVNKELVLSRMKSDFISTVSHEFKSPLTSIRQMTEMLFNDRIKNEERKKEYYATMLEQSERLSHLIENILDFSKIEADKKQFRYEKTDPKEMIQRARSFFKNGLRDKNFVVEFNTSSRLPEITVDREAMEQVLYNLLDNAYKYSGDSGKVEIRAESNGDSLHISVRDYGIGIEKKEQQKIFNRFYRGGNELTRTIKGSGIGLTLVKRIVEAHHGTVTLESTPGTGSTFCINLPV